MALAPTDRDLLRTLTKTIGSPDVPLLSLDTQDVTTRTLVNRVLVTTGPDGETSSLNTFYDWASSIDEGESYELFGDDESVITPSPQSANDWDDSLSVHTKKGPLVAWRISRLFQHASALREVLWHQTDRDVSSCICWVLAEQRRRSPSAVTAMAQGRITVEELLAVFPKGTPVVISLLNSETGATVTNGFFQMEGSQVFLSLSLELVGMSVDGKLEQQTRVIRFPFWKEERSLRSLPLRLVTPEEKRRLHARGTMVLDYIKTPAYRTAPQSLWEVTRFGMQQMPQSARVMIDPVGLSEANPAMLREATDYLDLNSGNDLLVLQEDPTEEGTSETPDAYRSGEEDAAAEDAGDFSSGDDTFGGSFLPSRDTWRMSPIVAGYSLRLKRWGFTAVETLRPMTFQPEAFDTLVLPPERKSLLLSLIRHAGSGFTDIISGKSGGYVFLLEGVPGTGKTLTAEASAEVLSRPLYSLSVGELGITPDAVEQRLEQALRLAARWNAVVLLDEADIFLERRHTNDVVRNAIVSVFLRVLEYYPGVLFLTTNRAADLDPAFASRIALHLPFHDLTATTRRAIWEGLCHAAGLQMVIENAWATRAINGREIKNILRLAQAAAASASEPCQAHHIQRTLDILDELSAERLSPKPAADSSLS